MSSNGIDNSKLQESLGLFTLIDEKIKGTAGSLTSWTTLLSDIKGKAGEVIDKVSIFDDKIIKASRSLGQSVIFAQNLESNFARVSEDIIKIGGDADDVIEIFKSMSNEMGRTVSFSNDAILNMAMLKKAGVADETIKSFNMLFDTIGGTFEEAGIQQMKLVNQAKSYGLNVGQFMSSVSSQLTKINQYGFPNGVKDISEMVVKSKMLGTSFESAQRVADKIMDSPEAAMDMAAKLQTLGGSFSSLADPMELLYLAQNDLAGLNDKLINATRGLATFNKETGQFEVSVQDRLRIKQVANEFGVNASEIIETSTKLAKQEQVLQSLNLTPNFRGLGEEEKRVIAQYAQLSKGGKIELEGKSLGEISLTEVTNILKKLQASGSEFATEGADATKNNIDMIQANSSSIEKVTMASTAMENAISLTTLQMGGFRESLDKAANSVAGIISTGAEYKEKFATTAKGVLEAASAKAGGMVPVDFFGKLPEFPAIKIEKIDPIKITLENSAQLETVIKNAVVNAINSITPITPKSVAEKPYGS